MSGNGLGRHFPALAAALPCLELAELPTPLEPAPALAATLGIGALAIKRDDRSSPLYGGNKVRKLDYLLADALARGCDSVVTYGSAGSNHALATAVFATRLGLAAHAVLIDQPPGPAVARKLRWLLHTGAHIHYASSYADSRRVAERLREHHPVAARCLYDIPWGGSSPLGATGFVAAALELVRQSDAPADYLYVSGGTMGTAIGLSLGLRAAGWSTCVVAPRAVPQGTTDVERTVRVAREANLALHAHDPAFPLFDDPLAQLELRPEFYGSGYAVPTPASDEATALAARLHGISLESTYTAKAFAGLVTDARAGRLTGQRVVYWHTANSAPYPPALNQIDPAPLPAPLRHYLEAASP